MLKSVARTAKHSTQATNAASTPKREPTTPEPMETIQAMKAMPHATGCRTNVRVKLVEVPASTSLSPL